MKGKVLMFHRVLPANEIQHPNAYWDRGTLITMEFFREILENLKKKEKMVWTLSEWCERQKNGENEERDLVLTFDDGYQDNFKFAFPLLKEYGFRATFFPVLRPCLDGLSLPLDQYYDLLDIGSIESADRWNYIMGPQKQTFLNGTKAQQNKMMDQLKAKIQVAPFSRSGYMTIEELKTMVAEGHEIGGHTMRHTILTKVDEKKGLREIKENFKVLRKNFGNEKVPFSYPDGRVNRRVSNWIKEIGFVCACTVEENGKHWDEFTIPRLFVKPDFNLDRL